jgi:HEAT repeat protein
MLLAMDRVYAVLKVRPGEARTAGRFLAFMVVVWTGFAVGGSGVEALLFARYGPHALPYLYIAVGVATFVWMTGMTVLLRRGDPDRLLLFLPLGFAVAVVGMRALVEVGSDLVYPVLWLLMMVMWTAQGVAVWGLASTLHDTRQAKRLFPLYGAGWILGSVLGGVATRPLALWIHAENLLLVWAACLAAAFLIARTLLPARRVRHDRPRRRAARLRPLAELADASRLVKGSPLLFWMAVSLTLFALLYFVLTLVFAEAVTARFPGADRLAGFLGLFMGVSNGIGFVTALFVANRLFARFGLVTMVLTLPVIYLAGFAVVSVAPAFLPVVAFRLVQVVWVNGIWASAWQSLFNVVPPERRHRVRTFFDGVPLQVGIVTAGILLILAERLLGASEIALVGVGAAAAATLAMWRARAAYGGAVVEALRVGNPEVFFDEEEPFGGYRRDAAAASVLLQGASHPDPSIRRIAMEILAETLDGSMPDAVTAGLHDPEPGVRTAALRCMSRIRDASSLPQVVRLLGDAEAAVRLAAAETLAVWSREGADPPAELRALLSDPDPQVRARAAGTLLRFSDGGDGRAVLDQMAGSPDPGWRTAAVAILGELGEQLGTVRDALGDQDASVRRAAATALRGFEPDRAAEPVVEALGDPDPTVRDDAVETAIRLGAPMARPLLEALRVPSREEGALLALARLPGADRTSLRAYAREHVARATHYHALWRRLDPDGDDRSAVLRFSLAHRARQHGMNAFHAMPGDPGSIEVAVENLASTDPAQRANALETLEAVGEPEIVRPLLAVWEDSPDPAKDPQAVLLELLKDDDPWLRACADFALKGGPPVETLSKLPLMERVLFLRKVRLFGELTPADLKQVAASATEHLYADGEAIAEQGELGDEMHIVVSGEIRVILGAGRKSGEEVARRRPGDSVGEMAIVSEEPRMASLVAEGEVRTLSIDRARFQRILKERPEASLAVMRVLCDRLRESHAREPGALAV